MKRVALIAVRLLNITICVPLIPYTIIFIINPAIYGSYNYPLHPMERVVYSIIPLVYSLMAIIPYKLLKKIWLKRIIGFGLVSVSICILAFIIRFGFSPTADFYTMLCPHGIIAVLVLSNVWAFYEITRENHKGLKEHESTLIS